MKPVFIRTALLAALLSAGTVQPLLADSDADLAKKTQNPIASLVSLPIQYNYDADIGPLKQGERSQLNIQPVIPVSIGTDWNLISRTIVPLISLDDVAPGAGSQSGLGDITQSIFFSPKAPTASGWIWGAGPVLLLPTGDDELTADKWGAGPTAVVLKQANGWTYGALANHIWSVAGEDDRADISATFMQPFLSFTTKTYTTLGINAESSYNWEAEQWSVPVNITVTQLLKLAGQPLTVTAGARYWADSPEGAGPEGWGARLAVTLLFPK